MKLYDNILEKVRIYEDKWGITYAKPDGKLYKFVMVFYVLALIFSIAMNLFFALGISMSETLLSTMKAPLYTSLILIITLIAAIVLTKFKKSIVAAICSFAINALSCVGLVLTFAPLLENEIGGYKASFYWRHLVPLCILLVVNFAINFIALRANIKTRKVYKKIVDNAYAKNHTLIEEDGLDNDEWDEILKNI
ncbi:MAG: hypothetical protein IJD45_03555 [Clostridia bacterium]|nr:hypothetical protein [Clostridia bacterium]